MAGVGERKEVAERGLKICSFYKKEEGCGCGAEGQGEDRPGDFHGNATGGALGDDGRSGWESVKAGSSARRRRGQRTAAVGTAAAGAVSVGAAAAGTVAAAAAGSMGGGSGAEADAAGATTSTTAGTKSMGNGRG